MASPQDKTTNKLKILEQAIHSNNLQKVKDLIENNKQSDQYLDSDNIVHHAVPHPAILQYLIDKGADINCKARYTKFTSFRHYHLILEDIFNKMFTTEVPNNYSCEEQQALGYTPLMLACSSSQTFQSAMILLEAGAKIQICDNRGHSALHYACSSGQTELVQKILQAGAIVDAVNHEGKQSYEPWG